MSKPITLPRENRPEEHKPRSHLAMLEKQARHGEEVSDEQLKININYAVGIRDGEGYNSRERMRAIEYLDSIIARGVDVAMYLDKNDRLDGGHVTERVGFVKYVKGVTEEEL